MINLIPKKKSNAIPKGELTFFEHLDALRPHIIRGLVALFAITIVAFFFKGIIIDSILFGPQSADFPTNRWLCDLGHTLGIDALCINTMEFNVINTKMAGQFNLHMTVSIVTGLVIAMPYLVFELWQFVKPALTVSERRSSSLFVLYVSVCFFAGLLFGYFIISPLTVNFLSSYQASENIVNMIDVSSYLSTVINVSLSCAVVFQLPILVYFLAQMSILTSAFMRKYRRHSIVAMAIFSAIITPPDVFSLTLVCLPLLGLYELSIRIAKRVEIRKAKEDMSSYDEIYSN